MRDVVRIAILAAAVATSLASPAFASGEKGVVFIPPPEANLDAVLHDAVSAQLSGVPVELSFEHFPGSPATLRGRVTAAKELSKAHAAIGAFWLTIEPGGDWLVYLAEPTADRVLVRRIAAGQEGAAASVESVAVILRQSTEALLSGAAIGMQVVEVPDDTPKPAPAPVPVAPTAPAAPPRCPPATALPCRPDYRFVGLALSTSYYGDSPASQIGWHDGLRVAAQYRFDSGITVGAGYVHTRDAVLREETVALRLRRTPVDVGLGFGLRFGRFFPSVEMRSQIDGISRRNLSVRPPLQSTADSSRTVVSLSPRGRVDYTATQALGVFIAAGVDVVFNGFSYVRRGDAGDISLVELRGLRPSVEAGIAFRP